MKISSEQISMPAPETAPKKISRDFDESLELKKHKLRKATKEFESFFVLHMLKAMRKTIPKSDMLNGGLGQDVYTSMFDEELARTVAGGSPNSLADVLYRSLEKQLELTEAAKQAKGTEKVEIPTSIKDEKRIEAVRIRTPEAKVAERKDAGKKIGDIIEANFRGPYRLPRISSDPVLKEYGSTINKASRRYKVDPRLIYSVIMTESGGRPEAVSSKGAKGLMQLVDSTAVEMGVADSLNPHQNIIGGTRYLRQMLDRHDGNIKLALAAYNAGPGTVSKYNGVPPFPETERYIENVLERLHSVSK
jgi:soluble lytic murein transglycosylase-like protein